MQKYILIIDDDADILFLNSRALKKRGYDVAAAETLALARTRLNEREPDAIVLDVNLPDGSGLDFCGEIRGVTNAPILLLTGRGEKDERLAGLRAGGDDYITKPYDVDELCERVAAFIRRSGLLNAPAKTLTVDSLMLDFVSSRAFWKGEDLLLSAKEFSLLALLAQSEGEAVSKELLFERVWKLPLADDGHALWIQISRLKRKLEDASGNILSLSTARGKGYKLEINNQ
jgi:DNA-binding response OmpR family regulator